MKTDLIPIMVPNTDVVLVTEKRHVVRFGGTREQPLIFIRGIDRAFWLANSKNLPNAAANAAVIRPVERETVVRAPDAQDIEVVPKE